MTEKEKSLEIDLNLMTSFPPNWNAAKLNNEKLFSFENGIWTGKKPPYMDCSIIRNTNFSKDGHLDLSDIAKITIERDN